MFQTLDAGWGTIEQSDPYASPREFEPRDRERDPGHALCGPIAIRGAEPGMVLEVIVNEIRPGRWGWSAAGGFPSQNNTRLGVADGPECVWQWALNADQGIARDQFGHAISLRPFIGLLGMPPDAPGRHSTVPPRPSGGNIDCKELGVGSRVYLPVPVRGGLFSVGDGHAAQGDGEVSGLALECAMDRVDLEFRVRDDLRLTMPRANTPAGWITFGFHEDLNEAWVIALEGMIALLQELLAFDRKEALQLSSLIVDLRITQVVNGVRGVHAILPHGALDSWRSSHGIGTPK